MSRSRPGALRPDVTEDAFGEGIRVSERHRKAAVSKLRPDLRRAVVPVDEELLGVVRSSERLAVQAQVQLPVVALAQHRRRDPAEAVVELAVALLRPEDHVRVGGLGGGEVELGDRRHHLHALRCRPQVVRHVAARQRGAHGLHAERERVAERVAAEGHRPLGHAGHLRAGQWVHRVLHLQRPLGLARLVEAGLLAARERGHYRKGDEKASAHERYY